MTISVNIHEAKTQFSHLLALIEQGEVVEICRRNIPIAELKKIANKSIPKREFGLLKGKVNVLPEFFSPMADDELALWDNAPIRSPDPKN